MLEQGGRTDKFHKAVIVNYKSLIYWKIGSINNPPQEVTKMKLSIIIPMYNEASTIEAVLDKIVQVELAGIEKEIIVVDDGSTDESLELVKHSRLTETDLLKVYASPINLGKGAAVRCGFRFTTGNIILIQDADLELNPQEYKKLLAPILANETQVVYGSRFKQVNHNIPLKSRLANKFLTTLTNILFKGRLTDMETAYKVFKSDVIKHIRLKRVSFDFEPEITAKLLKAGYDIYEVPVSYNPRSTYEGKKINWRDGLEAIWTLIVCRLFD
jgi:glycosyltransferase involved in cell wall biosynthesis